LYTVASSQQEDVLYPVVAVLDRGSRERWADIRQPILSLNELLEGASPPFRSDQQPTPGQWANLLADLSATVLGEEGFSPLGWPRADPERLRDFAGDANVDGGPAEAPSQFWVYSVERPDLEWSMLVRESGEGRAALSAPDDAFISVLPEGVAEAEVSYIPQDPQESQSVYAALFGLAPGPYRTGADLLLWRAYLGDHSWFFDGISRRAWGAARHAIRVPLVAGRRLVVGRIVRVAVSSAPDELTDPTYSQRRSWFERTQSATAQGCPDIRDEPSAASGDRVIAVHGTLSCAVPMAAAIQKQLPDASVRRFEHDTFAPISESAGTLAEAIMSRPSLGRVTLVGHSRGGLVAKHAAELIVKAVDDPTRVRVVSFGAPFKGSPLVDVASGTTPLLAAFAWLGVRTAGESGVPLLDRMTATVRLLTQLPRIPPGIDDMRPKGSYLDALAMLERAPLETVAGDYGAELSQNGYSFLNETLDNAQSAFDGAPNDLVVSVDSATVGGGRTEPLCHFDFFTNEDMLEQLSQLLA
jgi:hypothetical protein